MCGVILMSSERTSRRPLLRRPWNYDEDAKLVELLRQGKHTSIIAARLRRTPGAIRSRKDQLAFAGNDNTGTGSSA